MKNTIMMSMLFIIWFLVCCGVVPSDTNKSSITSPENSPKPSSSSATNGLPEPEPRWSEALKVWKWAWPVHVYMFIAWYLMVAMVSFAYLVIEFVVRRWTSNRLKVALFTNLVIFSITRGILLCVDPYNSRGQAHPVPYFMVWSIGFPFILSTFSILLLALVDTTRINLTPPRLQNLFTLTILSVSHLFIVFFTDLISIHYQKAKALLLLCQIYLSLFGLILSIGYIYVGRKLAQRTDGVSPDKMRRLQCLVFMSAVVGLCLVCVQVYSASSVFGVLSDEREIPPWPWLALQTCARSVEISMCIVVVLVFKKTKYNKSAQNNVTNQSGSG